MKIKNNFMRYLAIIIISVGYLSDAVKPAAAEYTLVAAKPSSSQSELIKLTYEKQRRTSVDLLTKQETSLAQIYNKKVLSFKISAQNSKQSTLNIKLACGEYCSGQFNIEAWLTKNSGTGWHQLNIPMHCFAQPHANLALMNPRLSFERVGKANVTLKDIQITDQVKSNYACLDPAVRAVTPSTLDTYWSASWWPKRHQQKLIEKTKINPELILIGDSITHGWERRGKKVWQQWFGDIKTLNLGYSGDRTENVIWRLQHGEVDGTSPKLIVIMIGTNNSGHRMDAPEYIAKGITKIVQELKQRTPNAKILLLDIFPRGEQPDNPLRVNSVIANQKLNEIARQYNLLRANFNPSFLEQDLTLSKKIMPDFLHPNEKGYQIWAEKLAPYFKKYLSQ